MIVEELKKYWGPDQFLQYAVYNKEMTRFCFGGIFMIFSPVPDDLQRKVLDLTQHNRQNVIDYVSQHCPLALDIDGFHYSWTVVNDEYGQEAVYNILTLLEKNANA